MVIRPVNFVHTLQSLRRDSGAGSAVLVVMVVVLGIASAWWALFGRIAVYETTDDARLEVARTVTRVDCEADARVEALLVAVGDHVQRGDRLIAFDDALVRAQLAEDLAARSALDARLASLRRTLALERDVGHLEGRERQARAEELDSLRKADQAIARLARAEARRTAELAAMGLAPTSEKDQTRAAATHAAAMTQASKHAATASAVAAARSPIERALELERLLGRIASLQGEVDTLEAKIATQRVALRRYLLSAPVTGTVASVREATGTGVFVSAGTELVTIVPDGELQVLAYFDPAAAAGRVSPGQAARVSLPGFPELQYGALRAEVARVSSEPEGGTIRVELVLSGEQPSGLPLEHGLPARAEVEVDVVTPLELLLRAAGQWRFAAGEES